MIDLDRQVSALTATVPDALRSAGVPGAAIGLCDSDGVLWSSGFGSRSSAGADPVDTDTIFSVQSSSKMYTATLVLLAVQAGLVDLDVPVVNYLPEFRVSSSFEDQPEARMTLRHLLSHSAGFTHEAPVGSNYEVGPETFDEHCQSIQRTWLRFPVGSHFEYSNLGIDLAGDILQRVTGEPFADLAHRLLFAPLGMSHTTFDLDVIETTSNRAVGHWSPWTRRGVDLPVKIPMVPSGGLYTSVDDVLRYIQFHLRAGEELLSPALLGEQHRIQCGAPDQRVGYGLGLYVDDWEVGTPVLQHGGGGFGFLCKVFWLPRLGCGAAVLTNSNDHGLQVELALQIAKELARPLNAPSQVGRPHDRGSTEASVEDPTRYVGTYVGRGDRLLDVQAEQRGLTIDGADLTDVGIEASGAMRVATEAGGWYEFRPDESGWVRYALDLNTGTTYYRNALPVGPVSPLPEDRCGRYEIWALGVPLIDVRLSNSPAGPRIELREIDTDGDGVPLVLTATGAGLFTTSTGETLDLRGDVPTYANIRLSRASGSDGR